MEPIQLRSRDRATPPAEEPPDERSRPPGRAWHPSAPPPLPTPQSFTSLVIALRWATTAAALLLLSTGQPNRADAVTGAAVLTYAMLRTVQPIELRGRPALVAGNIALEAAVMVGAVVATDYWDSPYVLGVVAAVSIAGFAGGTPLAVPTAAACAVAVAIPYHLALGGTASARLSLQWAGELVLVAMVAGYARRLALAASEESSAFMGRLQQLSETNSLLLKLQRMARTLPVSLDLGETLESSVARLRELFEPDVVVVLLRESDHWAVARTAGVRLGPTLADDEVPPPVRRADALGTARLVGDLDGPSGPGFGEESECAIYAPLRAHDELVGLLAVERRGGQGFTPAQVALVEAFTEQMAVAIDNARLFGRIGTFAAEEERGRIARDLHDRVGQSLALVGFELDRAAKAPGEEELRQQVLQVRETVRGVVGELRETLYDLRTDVTEERDLGGALEEFLDRVRRRSSLEITYRRRGTDRLPLPMEREIWRIAQEAITNAERHARARSLLVVWITDDRAALLSVADDGAGMPPADTRRPDAYGLVGMQERAEAIGATLTITSTPGEGTDVRVEVRR